MKNCFAVLLCFSILLGCFSLPLHANAAEEIGTETIPTPEEAAPVEKMPEVPEATEPIQEEPGEMVDTIENPGATRELVEETEVRDLRLDPAYVDRAQDVIRIAQIVQNEAGGDWIPFSEKVCVGLTILHRVDCSRYPDTVEEVISARAQYAPPADWEEVLPMSIAAAEYAMRLWESGMSYSILPSEFLYFWGDGWENHFHDFHGKWYRLPKIEISDEEVEELVKPYNEGVQTDPLFLWR